MLQITCRNNSLRVQTSCASGLLALPKVNADRADRLSRYVDVALKDAGILPDQSPGRAKERDCEPRESGNTGTRTLSFQKRSVASV